MEFDPLLVEVVIEVCIQESHWESVNRYCARVINILKIIIIIIIIIVSSSSNSSGSSSITVTIRWHTYFEEDVWMIQFSSKWSSANNANNHNIASQEGIFFKLSSQTILHRSVCGE